MTIEYVIVAPVFLLVFGLIFAFGRVGNLDDLLGAGARDAARAVSISPRLDRHSVRAVAKESVQQELDNGGFGSCRGNTLDIEVKGYDPDTHAFESDTDLKPGWVAQVTVSCDYSLSDLGLPLVPATGTAFGQFSSIIDPNRSAPAGKK